MTTPWVLLRRDDQVVERWRNGGGTTRTVAIDPPGASVAAGFSWRISVADVAQDGPFSAMPGVDRSLWLLDGNGVELQCGDSVTTLRERFQRLDFVGEAPIGARLLGGPVRDLNVMTRRGAVHAVAAVHDVPAAARCTIDPDGASCIVLLALRGRLVVRFGDGVVALEAGDALRIDRGEPALVAADGGEAAFLGVGFRSAQR
ncbi:MAG: HutD family protein [Planctomycetes bacterium]|nr:HutD family protein [Planctomycetota bacterium]